jgi:hypothetical protein
MTKNVQQHSTQFVFTVCVKEIVSPGAISTYMMTNQDYVFKISFLFVILILVVIEIWLGSVQ